MEKKTENRIPGKQSGARKGKRGKRKRAGTGMILLCVAAAVIVLGALAVAPFAFVRSDKSVRIIIPEKATYGMLSDSLHKYYKKGYADRVIQLAKMRDVDLSKRHGLYEIPKGSSALTAMRKLLRGAQTPRKITINHFRSLRDLCGAIAAKMEFSADDLYTAATNPLLLDKYGLTPEQALSLFLEDTYEAYWSTSPTELVNKIGKNYTDFWTEERKHKAAELQLTPADVMTIASITDEESNKGNEKGRIGRLYINRLHKGMRLQADPTVRYAIGDFEIKRVTKEHLHTRSPYNTYVNGGVPPGPIRTTSKATVKAILEAPASDDLYMCAREDFSGYHNFASNFEEHSRNARCYQQELNRRGIH